MSAVSARSRACSFIRTNETQSVRLQSLSGRSEYNSKARENIEALPATIVIAGSLRTARMASTAQRRRSARHSASATSVSTASVVTREPVLRADQSRARSCHWSFLLMSASQYTVSTKTGLCDLARRGAMGVHVVPRGEVARKRRWPPSGHDPPHRGMARSGRYTSCLHQEDLTVLEVDGVERLEHTSLDLSKEVPRLGGGRDLR